MNESSNIGWGFTRTVYLAIPGKVYPNDTFVKLSPEGDAELHDDGLPEDVAEWQENEAENSDDETD